MNAPTLYQQLQVVEACFRHELFRACALAAGAGFAALGLALAAHVAARLWRRHARCGGDALSAVLFCAYAAAVGWAASDSNKPAPVPRATLVFDRGLRDDGSVATNDWPSIRWGYDAYLANDTVHVEARPKGSTNDLDWLEYHRGPVAATAWSGHMPGCTGMVVHVWSEYVEPPSVRTNGVFRLDGVDAPLDWTPASPDVRLYVPIRAPVLDAAGGRRMSPPALPDPLTVEVLNMMDPQELKGEQTE